jgi:hypothetical protein
MNEERDYLDEIIEDEPAIEAEPVVEASTEPEAEPASSEAEAADGRARGADGKFIKKEAAQTAEAVEQGAKQNAEEPPSDSTDTHVPISVVQALRKELQELKASKEGKDQPQQPSAPQFQGPQTDLDQDPRGYIQGTLHQQKMQMSQFMAEQANSPETVAEAWQAFDSACAADPAVAAFSQSLVNHPHPMGEVVKWHNQQKDLAMLRDAGGLEALIAAKLAEAGQAPPASQTQANGKVPTPPSLTRRGGSTATDGSASEDDVFDDMFG